MKFNTISSFGIATFIILILTAPSVIAQHESVPLDVLELLPGGYAYADYPGVSTISKATVSLLRHGFI